MRVLVIDVGGTHVKVRATCHKQRVEFSSGPKMTPAFIGGYRLWAKAGEH